MNGNLLIPFSALVVSTIVLWCATVIHVHAAVPTTYTNDNFFTSVHDAPAWFKQDVSGNFYGQTESGKWFEQRFITNSLEVKLQRFSIDDAFFYVSDRGIILAPSDIVALSIYLARA
jgi:hypothetical protein